MIAFKDKTLKTNPLPSHYFTCRAKACCKAIRKVFRCILKKIPFYDTVLLSRIRQADLPWLTTDHACGIRPVINFHETFRRNSHAAAHGPSLRRQGVCR